MNRIALVTGASGAIGGKLVRRLCERGYEVRALVRENSSLDGLPESVPVIRCDLTDQCRLSEAVAGVDYVFHLAAKLHINNPAPELRDEYFRVNVEGTRCLAEVARAACVKRFVFFSTINVYGSTCPGEVLTEDAPLRPDSWYAETKIAAERDVLRQLPAEALVLRLAAVYGPRMKGNYVRLLQALRRRRLAIVGDGHNRRTLVYVDDVCAAAIAAVEQTNAARQILNVTDGTVHTLREIIEAMSVALGQTPPVWRLPAAPVRAAAGLIEDILKTLGRVSPIGRATIDKLVEDTAVSGDEVQRQLGFRPRYDLRAGWRETIRAGL